MNNISAPRKNATPKFCSNCGAKWGGSAKFCSECGATIGGTQAQPSPSGTAVSDSGVRGAVVVPDGTAGYAEGKNAIVAMLLSLVVVGMGQLYNGDTKKGIAMFVGAIVLGLITLGLLYLVFALYSAIDAYMVASRQWKLWE